jgi:hypothetical protein
MSDHVARHEKNEIFLVLRNEGMSERDWVNLVEDAQRIQRKLQKKTEANLAANAEAESTDEFRNTYDSTIFTDLDDFRAAWSDPWRLYRVTKLHIVAHGNQKISGTFSSTGLAELIAGKNAVKTHAQLERITVHSCMAGSPLGGSLHGSVVNQSTKNSIFVEQLASALAKFVPQNRMIFVRGSDGKSYTDVDGKNWILTDTKDDVDRDPSKPGVEAASFHSLLSAKNKIRPAKGTRWTATSVGTAT